MAIIAITLRRGDRGAAVTALHRNLECLGHTIDSSERDRRVFGEATEALISDLQKAASLQADGVFDNAACDALEGLLRELGTFTVHGRVLDTDGDPVVGAKVFAVDVDLRREQVLGQTKTDCHGEYEIRYSASKFSRAEKDSADLRVRCVLGDRLVAESAVQFNAPMRAEINLRSLERHGLSEYARLESAVTPLLDGEALATLKASDVPFLVGETGRKAALWDAFIRAQELEAISAVDLRSTTPEQRVCATTIPASAFYAWLRGGLPREWERLRATRVKLLRAKLVDAVVRWVIPHLSDKQIDAIIELIPNSAAAEVADLLGATVPPDVLRKIGRHIDGLDAVDDQLLGNLVATNTLEPVEAERVGLSISLARLAGAAPTVVASLLDREFPGVGTKLRRTRDLVAIDPEHWETALEDAGAPLPDGMTRAAQARDIGIRIASAYPEDAFRRLATRKGPNGNGGAAPIERLEAVLARNPGVSFVDLDYLPDSIGLVRVDFGDLDVEERAQVVADLKTHQRVQAVTGNAILANELKQVDLTSATKIAGLSVSHLAAQTGWPVAEAEVHHAKAKQIANKAALTWFGIYDLLRDNRTTPLQALKWPETFFKPLLGYAGLVNDQAWCECSQCQSVLSPAAYFVDVMHFIEKHILQDSVPTKHPLHLYKRRPDLWELELTCANTNDYVPYLEIVNEILESFLQDNVPFADSAAIYKQLAIQNKSFKQPFTLPLERVSILLEHFGVTRADVASAMQAPAPVQARARLGLSDVEYALITTDRAADTAFLLALYRLTSTVTAPDTLLAATEMAMLVRVLGLPHETVKAILLSRFVNTDGSTNSAIAIVLGKRNPQDVQNNSELVSNLTLRRLDRIHRFTRLWRALPWTVDELDHVLQRLSAPSAVASIVAESTTVHGTLERAADLVELGKRWALPVDELAAVVDVFPPRTLREAPPLFDRLFNQAAFVERDGEWTATTSFRFTHPSWMAKGGTPAPAGSSIPADNSLVRILAGLQLSDAEFTQLADELDGHPIVDRQPATVTADESIAISVGSINVFYRYAALRRLLDCKLNELFQLIELAQTPSGFVDSLADVRAVTKLAAWRKSSGFELDEVMYLVDTGRTGDLNPHALAGALIKSTADEHSLELAETLFTQLGLTEAQSIELVAANLTRQTTDTLPFERTAEAVRVRAIGLAGLVIPTALAALVTPATIAALLAERSPLHVADIALGVAFGRSLDEVARLRTIADPLDTNAVNAIARAIQGSTTQADLDRLELMITRMCRFNTLLRDRVFDVPGLTFVATHPEVFFGAGVTPPLVTSPTIDLDVVRNVAGYVAVAAPKDAGFSTASGPAAIAAIQAVVVDFAAASDADVAAALRVDVAEVSALRTHVTLPTGAFTALSVLQRCLELGKQLGVSGETLLRMIDDAGSTAYDQLWRAADDVFGAFRAKYPDAAIFAEKIEPFEDRLRSRKRDGLLEDFMTRWPSQFGTPSKLYEYFLVDVLVEGCARTSRVVAGTSSLQLYVHRVLMNLERSFDWNPIDPNNPGVWARFTDQTKRREWQWRKHYRVWEANRRVFLYPENYLEPELRDDKTPLFEELESSLLLQEIDKASVHDAYSRYITGFDEVARLKIAGAFYDAAERVLHVFGVTQDDAPVYYYRQVTETTSSNPDEKQPAPRFTPWDKLPLQIPVRAVSPIVFEGRLYVFWVETSTRPVNTFTNGTSDFSGYRHSVRVKFSMLRPDGAWAAPQVIKISEESGTSESRIVEDPRNDAALHALEKQLEDKKKLLPDANAEVATTQQAFAQALTDQATATANRIGKENAFKAPPDAGEIAAMALAAIFGGVPPEVTFALIRAVKLGEWKDAADKEAKAIETTKLANDKFVAAMDKLNALNAQIKALEDAILAQVTMVRWDASKRNHRDALDNYRPDGWQWDRVYPEEYLEPEPHVRLTLVPKANFEPSVVTPPDDFDVAEVIMRDLSPAESLGNKSEKALRWSDTALHSVQDNAQRYLGQDFYGAARALAEGPLGGTAVAYGPVTTQVQIVNGMRNSAIMETQGDSVWMRGSGTTYRGTRFGTSLTRSLAHQFWHDGPDSLLAPTYQETLVEVRSKISPIAGQNEPARQSPFHPDHACLTYFRETFFHIPFLVANHLNSQDKFADTQRWYHYIFDPTAPTGDPWRYREFRQPSQITKSLRELLVDEEALAAYRNDPFSPHAIARTRMTAYQKSIVMKYVDNLLDWGDSLFNQFTMESINEATMLYVMAQDILGPRPALLGSCGEGKLSPKSYNTIRPGLSDVSDFLVELEAPATVNALPPTGTGNMYVIPQLMMMTVAASAAPMTVAPAPRVMMASALVGAGPAFAGAGPAPLPPEPRFDSSGKVGTPAAFRNNKGAGIFWTGTKGTSLDSVHTAGGTAGAVLGTNSGLPRPINGAIDYLDEVPAVGIGVAGGQPIIPFGELDNHGIRELDVKYGFHDIFVPGNIHLDTFPPLEYDPVEIVPPKELVFCIPPNKDLLAYWDRVEDRLLKIRNCRDITGARRQLDLFAPELDPRLLVRMTAAGLSIDDVLNATSGNLPPYRFSYLIERAKQHASTVQSLGAQLLAAFEKGDAEELGHLRTVHEQNLLIMRRHTMDMEIRAAEDALESLRRQKLAVEYRHQHFFGLHQVGQIAGERKQQQLQGEASSFRTAAGIAQVVASILTIIPDMGAPTAMKFGGSQLGAAGRAVAEGLNALAAYNDTLASRAGVEASNQRRDQDWMHQVQNAKHELAQIEKNISAAEIRRDIALQALENHEQSIKQTEEMFAFFREKFSHVDRYRLMQKELRRLYRLAFNSALTLARMAEQAYRAERPGDITVLAGNYWEAESAGLLAGERLMGDLQLLERQFIERNYRELEVEHSFSLAQFAPDNLATLRVTGECKFQIPEWFFDLTYPGQYRRRLKAVRVTIPCVTGPHTNVGATLRLDNSEIRLEAPLAQQALGPLSSVPARHTVSIATSKAQTDGGVFEFSFRDERYMPFEGAGAVSSWTLSLPKMLHVFDYNTISDVILHLDYTALHDESLKDRWDGATAQLLALLGTASATKPLLVRTFNLRTDFPDAFHRMITNPANTEVGVSIETRHFPSFLLVPGRRLETTAASLRIVTPLQSLPGTRVGIGAKSVTQPQPLKTVQAPATAMAKGVALSTFDLGDVMETPLTQGGIRKALTDNYVMTLQTTVDPRQLQDIVLRVAYRLV
jgi:hypothetical protein